MGVAAGLSARLAQSLDAEDAEALGSGRVVGLGLGALRETRSGREDRKREKYVGKHHENGGKVAEVQFL